jgi:hypothetical protein
MRHAFEWESDCAPVLLPAKRHKRKTGNAGETIGLVDIFRVVLIIAGIMPVLDAVWAFRYNGVVVDNLHDAIFGHSLSGVEALRSAAAART